MTSKENFLEKLSAPARRALENEGIKTLLSRCFSVAATLGFFAFGFTVAATLPDDQRSPGSDHYQMTHPRQR